MRIRIPALLAVVILAAVPALAAGPDNWVPARWEGGPLELQRRARAATLPDAPDLRETIERWYDPATLDLLKGTPINCLLVTWSAGGDPDTERAQRQAVAAYARAARSRGIAVLGLVHGPADPTSVLQPAIDAGLDGLVLEGTFPDGERLASQVRQALRERSAGAVVVYPSSQAPWSPSSEIVAITDALAPGLQEPSEEAEASPSSEPWIDSNLWLAQSARSRAGSRPVWLMQTLPTDAAPSDYLRAIADAAAAGGRWVLAPGDDLRHGLRANRGEALAAWRAIAAFLQFRQEHAEWFGYPPLAVSGFVHDSAGSNPDMSAANLKLAVRARLPLRVIERARLDAASLERLRAVHALDLVDPTPPERTLLTDFVREGGLLLVGPTWQHVEMPEGHDFTVVPAGKGRVVVCRDDADPGELAKALVDLVGRERLGVRLFRAASVLGHASAGRAGADVLVHLVNYASYPAESVLVRVDGDFRRVRLYTPEAAPEDLALDGSGGRVEVTVGRLPVYGVLRFER